MNFAATPDERRQAQIRSPIAAQGPNAYSGDGPAAEPAAGAGPASMTPSPRSIARCRQGASGSVPAAKGLDALDGRARHRRRPVGLVQQRRPGRNQATLYGQQINVLSGLTYRARPNLLVGVTGGYENFSYTQTDINGKLKGDGWTVGAYLGWKIIPTLRYDAAVTYSGIGYDGTAGTAQGNFNGNRWMFATGFTGSYNWANSISNRRPRCTRCGSGKTPMSIRSAPSRPPAHSPAAAPRPAARSPIPYRGSIACCCCPTPVSMPTITSPRMTRRRSLRRAHPARLDTIAPGLVCACHRRHRCEAGERHHSRLRRRTRRHRRQHADLDVHGTRAHPVLMARFEVGFQGLVEPAAAQDAARLGGAAVGDIGRRRRVSVA